jgi:hypothetical protein
MSAFRVVDKENVGNLLLFSPPSKRAEKEWGKEPASKPKVIPSLQCSKFKSVDIEFGTVAVNRSSSQSFRMENPNETKSVTVALDKVPADKGLVVVLGDGDTVVIPKGGSVLGVIHWTPPQDMSLAYKLKLKLGVESMTISIRGIAGTGQVRRRSNFPL